MIGLNSDFRDFYDHWFSQPPYSYVLNRVSTEGLNKREQFALLEKAGFPVPLHGLVKEIWNQSSNEYLVVYDNEQLHCGEGKRLVAIKDINLDEIGERYASIFIPTTATPLEKSVSRRLLAIGDRMWWLRYESNSWMSNHAPDVQVSVKGETLGRRDYALEGEHDFSVFKPYPLFAIDFVMSLSRNQLMAIDFNSAPGMKNTGIEDCVSAPEVFRLICEFATTAKLTL